MADSWQKYLYQKRAAFAVDPLQHERSVRLLDVLVETRRRGSNPILYNIGSMFKLGSKESLETADRLREGLKRFESNTECEDDDEELFKLDRIQEIKNTVKSRASVKFSLSIFGGAVRLDVGGDKHLKFESQGVESASMYRAALAEIIGEQQWKPDVLKLTELKCWSEPRRGVFNCFGESVQNLWVIYEILKAKNVTESVDSHSSAVRADITTVVPVGGPPVGANLSMSATQKTLYTVANSKFIFGFRAIHARYYSTGEFFSFGHYEEGSAIPTVWGENESKNIHLRRDLGWR